MSLWSKLCFVVLDTLKILCNHISLTLQLIDVELVLWETVKTGICNWGTVTSTLDLELQAGEINHVSLFYNHISWALQPMDIKLVLWETARTLPQAIWICVPLKVHTCAIVFRNTQILPSFCVQWYKFHHVNRGKVLRYSHINLPICTQIMKNDWFHGLTGFTTFSYDDGSSNGGLDSCVDSWPPEIHMSWRIGHLHKYSLEQMVPKSALWHGSFVVGQPHNSDYYNGYQWKMLCTQYVLSELC